MAGAKDAFFPKMRSVVGLSGIATGHSGVDIFLATAAFDYYRLYLYSQDPHYLAIARQAYYSTKQAMNWDNTLGYPLPGLCSEAGIIGGPGPCAVNPRVWLPWITVVQLVAIVRLQQTFDAADIDELQGRTSSVGQKQRLHDLYSRTGGLLSVKPTH